MPGWLLPRWMRCEMRAVCVRHTWERRAIMSAVTPADDMTPARIWRACRRTTRNHVANTTPPAPSSNWPVSSGDPAATNGGRFGSISSAMVGIRLPGRCMPVDVSATAAGLSSSGMSARTASITHPRSTSGASCPTARPCPRAALARMFRYTLVTSSRYRVVRCGLLSRSAWVTVVAMVVVTSFYSRRIEASIACGCVGDGTKASAVRLPGSTCVWPASCMATPMRRTSSAAMSSCLASSTMIGCPAIL